MPIDGESERAIEKGGACVEDDEPIDWESLFASLLSQKFDGHLTEVKSASQALAEYARSWLDRVAREHAAEIWDGICSAKRGRNAPDSLEYILDCREPASDGRAYVAEIRLGGVEGEAVAVERARRASLPVPVLRRDDGVDESGDAPLTYHLLYAADSELFFFVGRPIRELPRHFRVAPYDAHTFQASSGALSPGTRYRCVSVGTALSALYRAHGLCSVNRLSPTLRQALVPRTGPLQDANSPWLPLEGAAGAPAASGSPLGAKLNEGQEAALKSMRDPVVLVQGPPGTGKSSFITEAFLRRIPRGAKVLGCTSTNKAIDSLLSKFEAAGITEMLVVGNKDRMGEVSQRYVLSARLATEAKVVKAEKALAKAENLVECIDEKIVQAKKRKKPKKDAVTGQEDNRGFVERQLKKMAGEKGEAKKTPGVKRLMGILGVGELSRVTNEELRKKAQEYLNKPPSDEDHAALEELRALKKEMKEAENKEDVARAELVKQQRTVRSRVWGAARFVACTASSAVHVIKRLQQAFDSAVDDEDEAPANACGADATRSLQFPYVILDEAGAMLEPDALGTLLHGAEAVLMVGDHYQLPPFTKWRDAERAGYNISLMQRLSTTAPSSGGGGSGRGLPVALLSEQYRMHPAIGEAVSKAFYNGRLRTAKPCAEARRHPLPLSWVEGGGREDRPEGATSFVNESEAEAAVRLVQAFVSHGGHAQSAINVLTFYNGQRSLVAQRLNKQGLKDVAVVSVDAMQGREVDVVILSCVRSGGSGGLGFLADWRRANVALSRARECLVVLGTEACLRSDRSWAPAMRAMTRFRDDAAFRMAYRDAVTPGSWALASARRPITVSQQRPVDPGVAEQVESNPDSWTKVAGKEEQQIVGQGAQPEKVPDNWDEASDEGALQADPGQDQGTPRGGMNPVVAEKFPERTDVAQTADAVRDGVASPDEKEEKVESKDKKEKKDKKDKKEKDDKKDKKVEKKEKKEKKDKSENKEKKEKKEKKKKQGGSDSDSS